MLTAVVPKRELTENEKTLGGLLLSTLLLSNSEFANRDGIGIFDTTGRYIKWDCHAAEVVFTEQYNSYLRKMSSRPTIGHVRAISTGVTAKDGAHPFVADHVLLAHNGTFTGYKTFVKEAGIGDPDPVDSHVAAGLLAKLAGSKPIDSDMICQVLKKLKGSYALLIADTIQPDKLWVVRGTSLLHIAELDPFYVINTSKIKLESALLYIGGVGKYLFGMDIAPTATTAIKYGSINTIDNHGLKYEQKTPKTSTTSHAYGQHYQSRQQGGRAGLKAAAPNAATKEHIARTEQYSKILSLPYLSPKDVAWAVSLLFDGAEWYAIPHESLMVIYEVLEEMIEMGSEEKKIIWYNIRQICPTPYETLARDFDVQVPYFVHTAKELGVFYESLREQ